MVIAVTSGKGGVGKTTVSANIATGLALLSKKVIVVDLDIGFRNLDIVLGLENNIVYTIVDVLNKKCSLDMAIVSDTACDNLSFLPSSQADNLNCADDEAIADIIDKLNASYDFVIVDCPTGIHKHLEAIISKVDTVIAVTTADVLSVRDTDKIISEFEKKSVSDIKLIINRIPVAEPLPNYIINPDDVIDMLGIDLIGIIEENSVVYASINDGIPIICNEKTTISDSFKNISRRLLGEHVPVNIVYRKEKAGMFKALFNKKQK